MAIMTGDVRADVAALFAPAESLAAECRRELDAAWKAHASTLDARDESWKDTQTRLISALCDCAEAEGVDLDDWMESDYAHST